MRRTPGRDMANCIRLTQVVNRLLSCLLILIHHDEADPIGVELSYIVSLVGRESGVNIISILRKEKCKGRPTVVVAVLYLGICRQRQMSQVRKTLIRVLCERENRQTHDYEKD